MNHHGGASSRATMTVPAPWIATERPSTTSSRRTTWATRASSHGSPFHGATADRASVRALDRSSPNSSGGLVGRDLVEGGDRTGEPIAAPPFDDIARPRPRADDEKRADHGDGGRDPLAALSRPVAHGRVPSLVRMRQL